MRFALAFVLALAASPALAQEPLHHHGPKPGLVVLSGEGHASAKPDMAELTTGVVTEATTAREALDANTASMSKLIDSLKGAGIESKDISTSGFSVQPRYVHPNPNDEPRQAPRITGYEVRNTVTVKVRDLGKLGAVLDQAVTEGSNQIDGLSFDIADKDELMNEARKSALADARAKAELYAEAAGIRLGRLRELSEQTAGFNPPRPMMMRTEMAKAQFDVPVEAGEQDLRINVMVTWEIEP